MINLGIGILIGATIMFIVGIIVLTWYHLKVQELIKELEGEKNEIL